MKKIILISICILFICACSKSNKSPAPDNPYGLPNATQTGANVFACRINGKNFIEYYSLGKTGAQLNTDTLSVFATKKLSDYVHEELDLGIKNPNVGITYSNFDSSALLRYISDSTCQGYSSPSVYLFSNTLQVKITKFDKVIKIVSGTFSSKVSIPNCDTISITDGRFDFNYY